MQRESKKLSACSGRAPPVHSQAMRWVLDALYIAAVVLLSPIWLPPMIRTGKIRTDWRARLGRLEPLPPPSAGRRRLLIHAVSVGEVNAIRLLVERLAAADHATEIVISVTTDTGTARARTLFEPRHRVVRYPLDLSRAVRRFLDAVRPDAVALAELEVWPNFTAACASRGIPIAVINGRLTARSAARYRRVAGLIRPSFRRLAWVAAQNGAYVDRFNALGVESDRIIITGSMKWDTAQIADEVPGAEALAEALGIDRSRPLVVAGSTAPGEHELLVRAVPDGVQLLCAPRKPEWFDQAAAAMPGCARRSLNQMGSATGRFLLDTIGELRAAYALADVVVVGRSFGNLHGSDVAEPVALGKATIVGPAVTDFQEIVEALLAGDGIIQTNADSLPDTLRILLNDSARRQELARNGRDVIRHHQGATEQTTKILLDLLATAGAPGPKTNSSSQR